MMTYNPQLISFATADDLRLPGLLYRPETQSTRVAIYLHGNGSSDIFYDSAKMNHMAAALNDRGIAFFPFNNRGAHYIKTFSYRENGVKKRRRFGTSYEVIRDCVMDIDGALELLKSQGYTEFILIGISTGANKIAVYDHYRPQNPVSRYIMLSGGDDTGLYYDMLGEKKFYEALATSHEEVEAGRGAEMAPKDLVDYPFSYQSLYDTLNPNGDYNVFPYNEAIRGLSLSNGPLFQYLRGITKQTMVIYGERDEYCYGNVARCLETVKHALSEKTNFDYHIIPGADHGFNGSEAELAKMISEWI